jgi:hypothetical protein
MLTTPYHGPRWLRACRHHGGVFFELYANKHISCPYKTPKRKHGLYKFESMFTTVFIFGILQKLITQVNSINDRLFHMWCQSCEVIYALQYGTVDHPVPLVSAKGRIRKCPYVYRSTQNLGSYIASIDNGHMWQTKPWSSGCTFRLKLLKIVRKIILGVNSMVARFFFMH